MTSRRPLWRAGTTSCRRPGHAQRKWMDVCSSTRDLLDTSQLVSESPLGPFAEHRDCLPWARPAQRLRTFSRPPVHGPRYSSSSPRLRCLAPSPHFLCAACSKGRGSFSRRLC